jgi:CIC family chloride channel protein
MKQDLSSVYSLRGFRRRLAHINAQPQFAILGVVSGIVTGLIILLFRSLIEFPLVWLLPGDSFEGFESLTAVGRFLLPVSGGLILAAMLIFIPARFCRVGVTHVLERLSLHQGHLPLGNALVQFFAGALALITGQSVGREGPVIHLGAAGSSLLGHYLKLPHNSVRVLVGCGVAGAISASFNTPLAGVIFSMEVILMEYTMAGFIPVILSAVTANLISRLVYADQFAFSIPQISMNSLYDVPYILLEGLALGIIAALFIKLVHLVSQFAPGRLWHRMILAGALTGTLTGDHGGRV